MIHPPYSFTLFLLSLFPFFFKLFVKWALSRCRLEKRKKDKEAILARQQLEKQKQKKIVKAAKKKVIDDD